MLDVLKKKKKKILQRSILMNENIKFSVQTVRHCCDLKTQSRPLKLVLMDNTHKFNIYHIYSVRKNRNVKAFATYGQPV